MSQIRIGATTITDFNRKEVIIPNKAFVPSI
ncbi:mechanosensitive ion channel domain-containing protein [Escherichia coli]